MEFDLLSKWMGLIALIVSVITGVWTLISKSTKPFDDRFDKLDKDITRLDDTQDSHGVRIQKVEDEMAHLPSKNEVHDIKLLMAQLEGHVGKIEVTLQAAERKLDRIERSIDGRKS